MISVQLEKCFYASKIKLLWRKPLTLLTSNNSMRACCSSHDLRFRQVLVLIFTVSMLLLTRSLIVNAETINIPDLKLRAVIEMALNKEVGADITQEDMAKLESLEAFEVGINDLTGIEYAINLKVMSFGLNQISDLTPLKGLKKLTVLDLHRNGRISDISALKGLLNLTWISLRGNRIVDMEPLKDLKKLTYLHIGYNRISDLSPLKDLELLRFLNLDENRILDLSQLSVLSNLRYLALDDNRISDLSPLSVLTNLKYLNLNDNQISDISPLSVLVKLVFIDLHGNNVSDLTPLKNMTEMTNLRLQENHITDISPLKGMTKLIRLILHDNHIFDFSPIAGVIDNLIEYDDSNQTAPPPHLITEPTYNKADVNRDGVVNIKDLVLIASNFDNPDLPLLASLKIYPDVNNDNAVNLIDLLIAASEIGAVATSPPLRKKTILTTTLTIDSLTEWIRLAKQRDLKEPYMLKGITVLESFLHLLKTQDTLPKEPALFQNYPNPFNPETWIPFQLSKPTNVTIFIYSTDRKLVRKLDLGLFDIGLYQYKSQSVYWDGKNEFGEPVASGVYFYTLLLDDFSTTRKMLIRK